MLQRENDRTVTVAASAGFCFGVARAASAVESEISAAKPGERIFTLGKLIHNDTYNSRLAARGVTVAEVGDIEALAREACESAPVKIFVRAHGITRETDELLTKCARENPHFSFVDCTCVFVSKIHKINVTLKSVFFEHGLELFFVYLYCMCDIFFCFCCHNRCQIVKKTAPDLCT